MRVQWLERGEEHDRSERNYHKALMEELNVVKETQYCLVRLIFFTE
jgi:hypothetical protein